MYNFKSYERPIVVAGTAISLGSVKSVKSDIGKAQTVRVENLFPPVDLTEITQKLGTTLNMADVDVAKTDLYKLEGRGRLFGGLFVVLRNIISQKPYRSKQYNFEEAITNHYDRCLSNLSVRIKESFGLEDQSPQKERVLADSPEKKKLPDELDLVATAGLLGIPVSLKGIKIDLLRTGLCSVRDVSMDVDNAQFLLDEDLGREAVISIAQDDSFVTNNFDKATRLCRTNAGNTLEPLIVAELHAWSVRNKNGTVKDFISAAFAGGIPTDLPSWIDSAYFCVDGSETKKGYLYRGIKDDVHFIRSAFTTREFQNKLLSPSTVKRPDFEAVMKGNEQSDNLTLPSSSISSWFLSISSKCYSKQFNDKDEEDLRSTNPNCYYRKADGTENLKCKNLRQMWESTLKENHGSIFSRCLRIHVCLPDVIRPDNNPGRMFVDEDNSLVMYITAANIKNIFRPDAVEVLKDLGYVQNGPPPPKLSFA
mmetsp:Transcript_5071/g.12834  ORF Transcript_5071/g.12834 Transcript_5071/m.12834 type:complete len:480 (-) Transcript_5071:1834-3273(-)